MSVRSMKTEVPASLASSSTISTSHGARWPCVADTCMGGDPRPQPQPALPAQAGDLAGVGRKVPRLLLGAHKPWPCAKPACAWEQAPVSAPTPLQSQGDKALAYPCTHPRTILSSVGRAQLQNPLTHILGATLSASVELSTVAVRLGEGSAAHTLTHLHLRAPQPRGSVCSARGSSTAWENSNPGAPHTYPLPTWTCAPLLCHKQFWPCCLSPGLPSGPQDPLRLPCHLHTASEISTVTHDCRTALCTGLPTPAPALNPALQEPREKIRHKADSRTAGRPQAPQHHWFSTARFHASCLGSTGHCLLPRDCGPFFYSRHFRKTKAFTALGPWRAAACVVPTRCPLDRTEKRPQAAF